MIICIYILGIIIWPFTWYLLGWKALFKNKIMYFPFVMCWLVLLANIVLQFFHLGITRTVELQDRLLRFLDQRASNILSALSSILVISAIVILLSDVMDWLEQADMV